MIFCQFFSHCFPAVLSTSTRYSERSEAFRPSVARVYSQLGTRSVQKKNTSNQPTNKRYTIYVRVSPKILKPTKIFKRDFPYKFEGELYFPASIRSDQPLIVTFYGHIFREILDCTILIWLPLVLGTSAAKEGGQFDP